MHHLWVFALAIGVLGCLNALPSTSSDLIKHFSLTESQVHLIDGLNRGFAESQKQYFRQVVQANSDEKQMLIQDFYVQVLQLQSRTAAVLTKEQLALAGSLMEIVALQWLIPDAQEFGMLPESAGPIHFRWNGDPSRAPGVRFGLSVTRELGNIEALAEYFHLSVEQISAIKEFSFYLNRARMNAMARRNGGVTIPADEELMKQIGEKIRAILMDEQQPRLKALDDAVAFAPIAEAAIFANIVVLPPPKWTL